MQQAANQSLRDGLHSYDRRHGWRGEPANILRDNLGKLDSYEDDDWRHPIEKGSYVTGLVLSVDDKYATIKIGTYRAILSPSDFAWTGRKKPSEVLRSATSRSSRSRSYMKPRHVSNSSSSPRRRPP